MNPKYFSSLEAPDCVSLSRLRWCAAIKTSEVANTLFIFTFSVIAESFALKKAINKNKESINNFYVIRHTGLLLLIVFISNLTLQVSASDFQFYDLFAEIIAVPSLCT